jgi:hypothetical protein
MLNRITYFYLYKPYKTLVMNKYQTAKQEAETGTNNKPV